MNVKNTPLIAILLFLQSAAFSQEEGKEKIYYDTLRLLDPKLSKGDLATPEDYARCINLSNGQYYAQLDKKRFNIADERELESFIRNNKKGIAKGKISIISDSKTKYNTLVNLIDLMTQYNITNYKVVSTGKVPDTKPIVVASKKPFIKDINFADSSVFVISITDKGIETSLLKEKVLHVKTSDLDTYIANKISGIDPDKVVITAPASVKYDAVEPVFALLIKHLLFKYHLISIDEAQAK